MTLLIAVLATALFGFVDYVGYNTIGQKLLVLYRILQTSIQIGIVVLLFEFAGFLAALSFLLLWWTFCSDMIYYGFCAWLRWFKTEPPNAFEQDVEGNVVTWAWWTPYGLVRGHKTEPIDGTILIAQAISGIMVGLAIQGFAWGVF